MYKNIFVKKDDVSVIRLDREKQLNAINEEILIELKKAFSELNKDKRTKIIIITGGKNFSAGADLKEMVNFDKKAAAKFARLIHSTFSFIENIDKPVIAAIDGYALGAGCELALVCDIRIASEHAEFGQPEVKLGIFPAAGATQRLQKLVGIGKAKEMIFTCEMINAHEAYRIGLVNKIVDEKDLMIEARMIADTIMKNNMESLITSKKLINKGSLKMEEKYFSKAFSTGNPKEGITALFEKRKPRFL